MSPWQKIINEIVTVLKKSGLKVDPSLFTVPPSSKMGDIALPCFELAKITKQNPALLAQQINLALSTRHLAPIDRVEAQGPYANFFLRSEAIAKLVLPAILWKRVVYGTSKVERPLRMLLEYSQPNTHKEFHVGHLRNVCLGWSLVELWRAIGHQVTGITYVNDVGMHVATCLWGLQKFYSKSSEKSSKSSKSGLRTPHSALHTPENRGRFLGEVYARATAALQEHPEWRKEVDTLLKKLEAHDAATVKFWKATRAWSLESFKRIYKTLGVSFNGVFYESALKDRGKEIAQELLERDIAKRSQGAVIMDFTGEGLDVLLLLKADGTGLYATSDLALAEAKRKKYSRMDRFAILTDARQTLYFKQLFKTLARSGWELPALTHLAYEFVTLPGGSMSSRKGNIIRFEDLFDEVLGKAEEETAARHPDWPHKKIERVASAIALAAIKFAMLRRAPSEQIVFDIKESLAFDGFTGPYLLYTVARINSIFRKLKNKEQRTKSKISLLYAEPLRQGAGKGRVLETPEERALLLSLARFPDVVRDSAMASDPSLVCKYLFDLAKSFSNFYEKCPVLTATDSVRAARLQLVDATARVVKQALALLGIKTVREM